jgi:hypothetical protein
MKTLGKLLSSAGKTEVMRALMRQPAPAGLRELSRIAGVHPYSAVQVFETLVPAGLVLRKKMPFRDLYMLNRSHKDAAVLTAVFDAADQGFIRARNRLLHKRARTILPFIKEARRMQASVTESRHVA